MSANKTNSTNTTNVSNSSNTSSTTLPKSNSSSNSTSFVIPNLDLLQRQVDERLAVGVAIFLGYLLHYCVGAAVHFMQKGKVEDLREIEKNMFMFGIAGVLSITWYQGGIYHGILAWFTLALLILIHATVFDRANEKFFEFKKYIWLTYNGLIFLWYAGIIGDFYHEFKF